MVRDLIAHGADVNAAGADGRTPLMMAAMQGWAGVVKVLLAKKAAVNARDHEGRLAIDYSDPGDHEIMNLLQKAGSKPPTGNSGRTVCDAERALDRLGYDTPIIDCGAGSQLRKAITKFQKENSLPPTGELDPATRKALNIR
jgi:murein L,D-transpeptidase YcbB/YkuD